MNEIVLNQWLDEDNGNTGIFTTDIGADNRPLMEMIVDIEGYQEGSGDPSPENIRPIVSYGGGQVSASGKNIFDKSAYTVGNVTYKNSDGSITRSGILIGLPEGTYKMKCFGSTVQEYIYGYVNDNNGNYKNVYWLSTSFSQGWMTRTVRISRGDKFYFVAAAGGTTLSLDCNLKIVVGDTDIGSYEEYSGNTYDLTFPVSVYKGKLDLWSGVLKVTQVVLNLGNTSAWYDKGYTCWAFMNSPLAYFPGNYAVPTDMISSVGYEPIHFYGSKSNNKMGVTHEGRIFVGNNSSTDKPTGQLTYTLAENLTYYQLTPQQINTLLKDNVIYTTFGKIKRVTYPCDKNLYVEKNFLS